ncbi:MAG TPA: FAD-binding oxidoreductase [Acidimicrobiales bacterium]|nr:FAD-binding oxidoreductase [Acidimicrobiales bacterium]
MPQTARRGTPTPPITLDVPASAVRARLAGSAVAVDDGAISRLKAVCERVETDDEARTEAGRDWWPLAISWALGGEVAARPAAVARPSTAAEVAAVLATCADLRIPVTAAAGRSGVCGNSVPVFGGVVLDLTGLTGIVAVDDKSLLVDVRPGTFGDVLEDSLRARPEHPLTLGHWPQSIALSTVGGWLACRSAGQYSTRYGKIEDMVVGLEVALANGQLIRTGRTAPRAAVGPDLTQLFVGCEGTLGVITEARLRAHPVPLVEGRSAFGFDSFAAGLDSCRRILRRGATPAVLRLYDVTESKRTFEGLGGGDRSVLIVLDEGEAELVNAIMGLVAAECRDADRLDDALVEQWLSHRNDVSALESVIRQGIIVDTIEIAARWSVLPAIYEEAIATLQAIDATLVASAHQSHAYRDGACLYFTFAGRPAPVESADRYYQRAWDAVMRVTLSRGGALSHHHGIGINRGRFVAPALGPAFDVLVAVKAALDPHGILNPGKLGLPSPFGEVPWP